MEVMYRKPLYAILSHTWEGEEPTYQDFCSRPDEVLRGSKISGFIAAAKKRRVRYVWIDTICIDKTSSSELQEAINSMFTWYAEASFCIAYLSDVTWEPYQTARNSWSRFYLKYSPAIRIFLNSRWFTRGWTLQELIAPEIVHFYDSKWSCIIEKAPSQYGAISRLPKSAIRLISEAAGVPAFVLEAQEGYRKASMAQRMSWAASRQTTRIEDRAYSLMGLFDVHMPMLYGEGSAAFTRLREEIMKRSNDQSLLAYNFNRHGKNNSVYNLHPTDYTLSPANYSGCSCVIQWDDPNEDQEHFSMTNMGLLIKLKIVPMEGVPGMYLARLNCHQSRSVPHLNNSYAFPNDEGVYNDYSGYYEDFEHEENDFVVENDDGESYVIAIPLHQPQGHQRSNTFYRPTPTSPLSLPARLFETDAALFKTIYIAEKPYSGPVLDGMLKLSLPFGFEWIGTYPPSAIDPSDITFFIRHSSLERPKVVYINVLNTLTRKRQVFRADLSFDGNKYAMLVRICSHASFHSLISLKGVGGALTPDSIDSYPSGTIVFGAVESGIPVVIRYEPATIFIDYLRWPEYKESPRLGVMRCLLCGVHMSSSHGCERLNDDVLFSNHHYTQFSYPQELSVELD